MLGYTPLQDEHFPEVTDLMGHFANHSITAEQYAQGLGDRGFDVIHWFSDEYLEWASRTPDVKVLLTVRDNPPVWAESFSTTISALPRILQQRPYCWIQKVRNLIGPLEAMWLTQTDGQLEKYNDLPTLERAYTKHIETVKRLVPPEKLLVFNVKDGWEPLCSFLEKPMPNELFPFVNDRVVIQNFYALLRFGTWAWPVLFGLAVGLPVLLVRKCNVSFRLSHSKTA